MAGQIEFLDADPGEPAEEQLEAPPHSIVRWVLLLGVVAVLGGAVLVARAAGGDGPVRSVGSAAPSTSAPSRARPNVGLPVVPIYAPPAKGARLVYVAGCTGCVRVSDTPIGLRRAVAAVADAVLIRSMTTVISATNGRVFSRTILARVGSGTMRIDVLALEDRPSMTSAAHTGDRLRVVVLRPGYRVDVRVDRARLDVAAVIGLAKDERLLGYE